jgi:trimethylguanosine synthase
VSFLYSLSHLHAPLLHSRSFPLFLTVIALDTSPTRLALARHNAEVYGVAEHIEFILADYISFARSYLSRPRKDRTIDVVFLSPPWGGPGYLSGSNDDPPSNTGAQAISNDQHPEYSLSSVQPLHGAELFALTRRITPNVAYFLPRNTSLQEISELAKGSPISTGSEEPEHVEVEEEWMGSKLKALTCYFGGLAAGQEELFNERPGST